MYTNTEVSIKLASAVTSRAGDNTRGALYLEYSVYNQSEGLSPSALVVRVVLRPLAVYRILFGELASPARIESAHQVFL